MSRNDKTLLEEELPLRFRGLPPAPSKQRTRRHILQEIESIYLRRNGIVQNRRPVPTYWEMEDVKIKFSNTLDTLGMYWLYKWERERLTKAWFELFDIEER